ncbi:YqaJ viral recombinase family protein [Moumouvirus australiensis]|uniref:YqaJ viral recombinase family protein n=1 Tax=Moumouvirus australiensis TaxID=2109587 RepID=A0A2P1ELV0_9VIRU|nr:YqaJ viral recombinase family protein [Moumouvirus australiensis]AVL94863.1 YqaJ viral recombinase family protein [Moumouvirus australiensis]
MNLNYYNQEIDRILWDLVGNDYFTDKDLDNIINLIAETIYIYNKNLSKSKLKTIARYLIEQKHIKHYIYDKSSEFNNIKLSKNDKTDKDICSLSLNDILFTENSVSDNINDKINLNTYLDLISHKYDYNHKEYKKSKYIKRLKRVEEIKKIPQFEQKSKEWLDQRNECLTATAISKAIDEDPYEYPVDLLFDKCGKKPFVENENVHHGNKYEEIGTMFYSFRNNVDVKEYGLLQHHEKKMIGASPDGICDSKTYHNNKLSKLIGRLLEIKFPKTRQIMTTGNLDGDICPHYYYLQVQAQLFVTELDECDFLQCKIEEYDSWEEYILDSNAKIPGLSKKTNLEKGCLIQLLPKKMISNETANRCLYNSKYIYPPKLHMTPDEIEKWISYETMHFQNHELSSEYLIDRIIYWRLSQISCSLIKADSDLIKSKLPILEQFWDYVLFYRQFPDKLEKLMDYVKEVGRENSAQIFSKINKEYLSVHKKSTYKPLYQEPTKWRLQYNEKKKKYANYKNKFYNKTNN